MLTSLRSGEPERDGNFDHFSMDLITRLGPDVHADLVWTNPLGGRTYRLERPEAAEYLKVAPADAPPSHHPAAEAQRLAWIGSRVRVPEVLDSGRDPRGSWLRTRELPGIPASDLRWRDDPRGTASLLGRAVRRFHDALTSAVPDCPWSWRIADRVAARRSPQVERRARSAPPELDLVVGHGDLCAPNILLTDSPNETGYLDLGKLGVADRAADLGCHMWSLEYNQLDAHIDEFLDTYGFEGDRDAVRWYRDFYEVA